MRIGFDVCVQCNYNNYCSRLVQGKLSRVEPHPEFVDGRMTQVNFSMKLVSKSQVEQGNILAIDREMKSSFECVTQRKQSL